MILITNTAHSKVALTKAVALYDTLFSKMVLILYLQNQLFKSNIDLVQDIDNLYASEFTFLIYKKILMKVDHGTLIH